MDDRKAADDDAEELEAQRAVENSFNEAVQELIADGCLHKLVREFERVHAGLVGSREQNQALLDMCHKLNQEIVANAAKMALIVQHSRSDQITIESFETNSRKPGASSSTPRNARTTRRISCTV
jgi:hypothetical protein